MWWLFYWQKVFDQVNWTKLMQILKGTGIDWHERRLLATCTWLRVLKYDWTEGRQEVWRLEEELDKDIACHHFCSTCTANALPRSSGRVWRLPIWGQIVHTVKYVHDLVLLAKEEVVLQDMVDKLNEIRGCYGMEMNVEKNKSNENFKTTIPSKNYDRPKTTRECGNF